MFSKLLRRLRVTGPLVVLATVSALVVAGVPAVADPVAQTAAVPGKVMKQIKRALGLSKKADRRSKQAIRLAKQAGEGAAGPQGAQGAAGPQGAPGPRGAQGAPGPQGPQGPAGANGADGVDGTDGTDGTDGADGEDGSPWTAGGTLPPGATQTGGWAYRATAAAFEGIAIPISFAIPLPGIVPAVYIRVGEDATGTACEGGTVAAPRADPGFLCVFAAQETNLATLINPDPFTIQRLDTGVIPNTASSSGAYLSGAAAAAGNTAARGSFAVTAPEAP